jgi:transposase-like protein
VSMLDYKLDRKKVRRLEVITGACRWHQFTEDFKAQVVEETLVPGPRLFLARACSWPALVPGAAVSDIARRAAGVPMASAESKTP